MTAPVWGVPWHGRVQGGLLHLPNDTTRTWPQPDGTSGGSITDHAGYTFLQKLPGVAEIVRTPEEQAADEAAGMEWRDSFIVSGTDTSGSAAALQWPQIHSKKLGGWIYAAPGGGRWLVKGGGTYNFSQGGMLNIPLRLVKFGDFGGGAVTINLTASISSAAMGQSSPSLPDSSFSAKVEDITPAGNKAIVMLYASGKVPVGFLLLTLAGLPGVDFTAILSPLKTRTETLGVVDSVEGASRAHMIAYHDFSTSIDDQCAASNFKITTYTPTAFVRMPEWWQAANVYVGSGENRMTLTGRVMAMWFDAEEEPQPLLLDSLQSYVVDAPLPTNTVSGQVVLRESCNGTGGLTWLEYMTTTRAQAVTETVTQTMTLSFAGEQVTTEYKILRASSMESQSTDVGGAVGNVPHVSRSGHSTDSRLVTIDGVAVTEYSTEQDGYSNFHFVGNAVQWTMPATNIPNLREVTVSARGSPTWRPTVKRWSNNLIGLRTQTTDFSYGPAFSPLGIKQPATPAVAGNYGSLNPSTGEAIFPSATPVSWT